MGLKNYAFVRPLEVIPKAAALSTMPFLSSENRIVAEDDPRMLWVGYGDNPDHWLSLDISQNPPVLRIGRQRQTSKDGLPYTTDVGGGAGTDAPPIIIKNTIIFNQMVGSLAHHELSELLHDDHTIYLLLAGRAGGQTARGGTASGDDLTLDSTVHATKGDIYMQPSGGEVIVGHNARLLAGVLVHLIGAGASVFSMIDCYSVAQAFAPTLTLRKSNNATKGTATETTDGHILGFIEFEGVDTGSNFDYGALIQAIQMGAAGTKLGTKLRFYTYNSTGINAPVVIDAAGKMSIGTDVPYRRLDVLDISDPQLRLTHTPNSIYAEFQVTNDAGLAFSTQGGAAPNQGNITISANNSGADSTVYVRNSDATHKTNLDVEGDVIIGRNLSLSASKSGTAVLVDGTVTIANATITANTRIFAFCQTPGGGIGSLYCSARVVGVSFTLTSTNILDTSTIAWMLLES